MRTRVGVIGFLAIALSASLPAQEIPPASIVDKEMGWMRIYNFKEALKPQKVDHRVYTPAQLAIAADLASWMQASYSPIGGRPRRVLLRRLLDHAGRQAAAQLAQQSR